MKEIGGYIEFEYFHGQEYHENAIKLNCGRSCLAYLIKAHSIQKIYIPAFLCSSVYDVCKEYSVYVEFYNINEDFSPILPSTIDETHWVYLVNYYAQLDESQILRIKNHAKNLILDNTQNFFAFPISDIPHIYTCRKWFGIPDGAYLYNSNALMEKLETECVDSAMEYLLGRFEETANKFYAKYKEHERNFAKKGIKTMSRFSHNLLRAIDYEYVKQQRTQNFAYLESKLNTINKINPKLVNIPFAYPLYLENGSEVRKRLQEKNIYIPTLWPDVLEKCPKNSLEYKYTTNILPLPVDQRYGEEEMKMMVEEIDLCTN